MTTMVQDEIRDFTTCAALTGPVAVRAAQGGGKLPTFSGLAYSGAPMRPSGWYQPVIIDLTGVKVRAKQTPIFRQHDAEQILGHSTDIKVNRRGIFVDGVFSGQQEHVDKVVVPAKAGFSWQLSVGASPLQTEYLEAGEEEDINGRTVKGPLTISRQTELGEISFVAIGADSSTEVSVAASAARGLARRASADAALEAALGGELERCKGIMLFCMRVGNPLIDFESADGAVTRVSLLATAIECGWSADDVSRVIRRYTGDHLAILPPGTCVGQFSNIED